MAKPSSRMRDGLQSRGDGRWTATLYLGRSEPDANGKRRIIQKTISLGKCSRQEARAKREELLVAMRKDELVVPSRRTVGEWLKTWLDESIRPAKRTNTVIVYENVITNHLMPALGGIQLQTLRPGHLTKYYGEKRTAGLSGATLQVHHAVIGAALKSATRQGLITRNVAALVDAKPRATTDREQAKQHCWSAEETRAFLTATTTAGPQFAALFTLAVDSGARRGELLALRWTDLDLDAGTVTIDRTLLSRAGADPVCGPTKRGTARTVDLNTTTVARLRQHRVAQAELKMRNRIAYTEHGLVFAREWTEVQTGTHRLGQPLSENTFAAAMDRIIKVADVRRIKPHGLRHTSATLLLAAGEPAHVVAARLGHANAMITLGVYAHALPGHGRQAAATLGRLLHGNG
jgi:integrase